jgi:hypothetical protein
MDETPLSIWTCATCQGRIVLGTSIGDEMLERALAAYYSCGDIEDAGDFEYAMREALAAALEVAP